jgi:hypothetical protein
LLQKKRREVLLIGLSGSRSRHHGRNALRSLGRVLSSDEGT